MNAVPEWIGERPARAFQIYYGGSRKAAITEFCIWCVGTAQEAKKCPCTDCPLWMYRPGADDTVPDCIPPKAELERMREANVSDAVREHARKLGQSRAAGDHDES